MRRCGCCGCRIFEQVRQVVEVVADVVGEPAVRQCGVGVAESRVGKRVVPAAIFEVELIVSRGGHRQFEEKLPLPGPGGNPDGFAHLRQRVAVCLPAGQKQFQILIPVGEVGSRETQHRRFAGGGDRTFV